MRAVIVESPGQAPRFGEFEHPKPEAGEVLVTVAAAALSNLVKAQASGKHYSSAGSHPFVPGNDGVGRTPEGQRVYFLGPRAPFGSMAAQTVVAQRNTLALPEGITDLVAAALGNPGLATWGALLGRARLQAGETVLINGATGVSGQQAIQAAKFLGAGRVIATGRNAASFDRLCALGADEILSLEKDDEALLGAFRRALQDSGGTQVVLDFLWGHPAELLLQAAGGHGAAEGAARIRFVQIGSAAGKVAELSAEWLRSSGVELLGSGLGSLATADILSALQKMHEAYLQVPFAIDVEAVPIEEAPRVWGQTESGRRTVFTL